MSLAITTTVTVATQYTLKDTLKPTAPAPPPLRETPQNPCNLVTRQSRKKAEKADILDGDTFDAMSKAFFQAIKMQFRQPQPVSPRDQSDSPPLLLTHSLHH